MASKKLQDLAVLLKLYLDMKIDGATRHFYCSD
jgi:hypothetical protein